MTSLREYLDDGDHIFSLYAPIGEWDEMMRATYIWLKACVRDGITTIILRREAILGIHESANTKDEVWHHPGFPFPDKLQEYDFFDKWKHAFEKILRTDSFMVERLSITSETADEIVYMLVLD